MRPRADPVPKIAFLAICAAIVLSAGWALWTIVAREGEPPNRGGFQGPGGRWLILADDWHRSGDHWLLRADVMPWALRDRRAFERSSILGLCGGVLVAMPDRPKAVGSRRDLFRLDLTISFRGDDGVPAPIHAGPLPIAVPDGACAGPGDDDVYAPGFAPPFDGLKLTGIDVVETDGTALRRYSMEIVDPTDDTEFDLKSLCSRIVADPWVRDHTADLPDPPDVEVVVGTPLFGLAGYEILRTSREGRFIAIDAGCVDPTPVRKT